MCCLLWELLILGAAGVASGAKILLAAPQLGSHVLEQIALGEELVARGHHVYMAIGSRYPNIQNIENKGIKTIQYHIPDDVLYGVSSDLEKALVPLIFSKEKNKMSLSGNLASNICLRDCALMMNDKIFMEEVRKITFDLAVVGTFILAPCNLILPKYFGIPFVSNSIFFIPWKHGIPALPSFTPILHVWTNLSDITLAARLENFLMYAFSDIYLSRIVPQNMTLLEHFAPEYKNWHELINLSELFLMTSDHHLGAIIPQLPNVISMAGLSTSMAKPLPEDLETIAESSKDGIVLLSFGSAAYYFPVEVIVTFLDAFAKLNQTVLVKFHIPEGVSTPKNVKALSWLPQNDILGHPKTKLFITHCGNSGQHEALYHGVPMIGFPLFAEQHANCQRGHKKGFGLAMNIQDFTSEELFENIHEVLYNQKYKSAIKKASDIFRDQPMHPRERGAFWIEHVIRHGGGKHLRSFSMDMPLYQFLMLDILGLLLAAIFVAIFSVRMLLRYIFRRCIFSSKSGGSKKLKSS